MNEGAKGRRSPSFQSTEMGAVSDQVETSTYYKYTRSWQGEPLALFLPCTLSPPWRITSTDQFFISIPRLLRSVDADASCPPNPLQFHCKPTAACAPPVSRLVGQSRASVQPLASTAQGNAAPRPSSQNRGDPASPLRHLTPCGNITPVSSA